VVGEENITGEIIAKFLETLAEKLGQETDAVCFADWVHYPPKPTPDYTGDGFAWLVQRDAPADGKNRLTFFCIGPNARCYIAQGDFQAMQTDPRYLENIFPAVMRQVAGATTQPCHRLVMISPDNIGQIQRDYVLQLPTEAKSVIAMLPKLRRQLLSKIIISHLDRRIKNAAIDLGDIPVVVGRDNVILVIGQNHCKTNDNEPVTESLFMQLQPIKTAVNESHGSIGVEFYHDFSDPGESPDIVWAMAAQRARDMIDDFESGISTRFLHPMQPKRAFTTAKKILGPNFCRLRSLIDAHPEEQLSWLSRQLQNEAAR
jgi:hypothetical protein